MLRTPECLTEAIHVVTELSIAHIKINLLHEPHNFTTPDMGVVNNVSIYHVALPDHFIDIFITSLLPTPQKP